MEAAMSKVLVVDDNIVNRELLKIRLRREGHSVSEAVDGVEGLEMALSIRPDMVFMDVMMPRMDGWEACRLLKADPATRGIPVYMVSALSEGEDPRSENCGANGFIPKPCDAAQLKEALSHIQAQAQVVVTPGLALGKAIAGA
jgi:CheY-like chemotaxis protein